MALSDIPAGRRKLGRDLVVETRRPRSQGVTPARSLLEGRLAPKWREAADQTDPGTGDNGRRPGARP
jgi:hypothetical protein